MQMALFSEPKTVPTFAGRTPRPYQIKAVRTAFEQFDEGIEGTLLRSPTGTGKSFMLAMAIHEWLERSDSHRAIIGLHEITLIHQLAQDLQKTLGISVGVEQGEHRVNMNSVASPRVVIFSRQSLDEKIIGDEKASRLYKFDHSEYQWLFVLDECHRWRYGMPSCKHVIEWFAKNEANKRLGLTATPKRRDKAKFTKLFPSVCLDYRFTDAVNDGWLVPFKQQWVNVKGVHIEESEVTSQIKMDKRFDELLADVEQLRAIVEPAIALCHGQTIAYCPDVKSCYAVAAEINAQIGWNAAKAIDGSIKHEERQYIYEQHKRADFQFLVVCNLCIAKGTLVLTDRGEVPIEDVTTEMKVWDGVEFVSHDGVISKGVRSVINYAGLTATENHNVWTDNGWKTLADCKLHGTPIAVSAIGGRPIREAEGYYRGGCSSREVEASRIGSGVHGLREGDRKVYVGTEVGPGGVQELRQGVGCSSVASVPMPSHHATMHESELPGLPGIRGPWNQNGFRVVNGDGSLDYGEPWIAQGNVTGSDRKQRKLRTGEHSVRHEHSTGEQQTTEAMVEETEVYDILNAGPRYRFTANGLIVSNCREGYDDPNVSNILCLRPVRKESSHLAEQMKGRGVRPHSSIAHKLGELETAEQRRELIANSGKPFCHIIDLAGITGLKELPTTLEILAEGLPDDVLSRAKAKAAEGDVDPMKAIEEATEEIKQEKEEQARREAERRAKIKTRVEWEAREVGSGQGGSYQRNWNESQEEMSTWKQVFKLTSLGVNATEARGMTKAQASKKIQHLLHTKGPSGSGKPTQQHIALAEKFGKPMPKTYEDGVKLVQEINAGLKRT